MSGLRAYFTLQLRGFGEIKLERDAAARRSRPIVCCCGSPIRLALPYQV